MQFFEIGNTAFKALGYPVSYVELIGTLFGFISVYFASKANILTWPTGIVNEAFLFMLFFQVQLYADMFLQIYFFVVTLYGWYKWNSKLPDNKISALGFKTRIILLTTLLAGTLMAGFFFSNIHLYMPRYFAKPAAFPFADSFVMVASIVATVLLARKKIETWHLWIAVDVVCVGLYFKKEVYFLSLEYFVFLGLASYGLYHWRKQMKHD